MKKFIGLIVAGVIVLAIPQFTTAAEEEVTLTGEAVDIKCYTAGRSGESHAGCATTCASKGQPIGFLTEKDGKKLVYLVVGGTGKAAKDLLADHMGKKIKVTGTVVDADGLKVFTIKSVDAGA